MPVTCGQTISLNTVKVDVKSANETWLGEHSYLTTRAGEIIEKESLDILNCLKRAK